ncbi:hypothetical protein ACIQRW_34010 [Streptomyces sp. NPDC091287]|uniref:hypothetical protein n=1 Tax=Streptomyces sp. NPDC091287 TaxID=3365988 RepID=UPI00380A5C73
MSAGSGPLRVETSDGAVWVQAAVTRAGLGLYCPEGVVSCPRFVVATLAELAEHGVKAAPPVTDVADAVALLGALPMPVGEPMPVELSEQQLDALSAAGNRALNDHYHEDLCFCREWPTSCVSSGNYFMGTWDTSAFDIGLPAVLGVWESLRNGRHAAKIAELRADNERLRARVAELEAATYVAPSPSCTRCYGADAVRFVAKGGATAPCRACAPSELEELRARVAELEALKPARFQTCRACGAGYEYGQKCSGCEFKKQMAAASVEDPHDSPLHQSYALGHDLPEMTPPAAPADPRRAESVSKLRALLSRQTGGPQ